MIKKRCCPHWRARSPDVPASAEAPRRGLHGPGAALGAPARRVNAIPPAPPRAWTARLRSRRPVPSSSRRSASRPKPPGRRRRPSRRTAIRASSGRVRCVRNLPSRFTIIRRRSSTGPRGSAAGGWSTRRGRPENRIEIKMASPFVSSLVKDYGVHGSKQFVKRRRVGEGIRTVFP